MNLSVRKEKILQAVVDRYIDSCEPISSAEIQEHHLPALSTATIRNELATLEEMGYLVQPHTSAGRIPTAEAYRLYVEKLMPKRKLTRNELEIIKKNFSRTITELDDLLKSTAKVISEITNLTSVAYSQSSDAIVNNIKLVKITDISALVIIVTNLGLLKNVSVTVKQQLSDEYFLGASSFITKVFGGHTISEILEPHKIITEYLEGYEEIFKIVLKILESYSNEEDGNEFVLEGSAKMLEQPEYSNLSRAKAMLKVLDAKDQLMPMFKSNDDMSLNITISKDNEMKEGMPECAIVTASYSVNGVNIGKAGVIGPIRMDYPKVISVLDYIGKTINMLPDKNNSEDIIDNYLEEELIQEIVNEKTRK